MRSLPVVSMRSKASYVRKGSKSLKTIIPESIVEMLKLSHGSELEWEVEASDNKLKVSVRKAR